jgi:hypothetical protein
MSKISDDQTRPRYAPYDGGTYRMAMGLRGLEADDWLEPDQDFVRHLREKRQLLIERPNDVLAGLPGSEAAQREVLDLAVEHMTRLHPDLLRREGDRLEIPPLDEVLSIDDFSDLPVDLAGRLAQEDFCLMRPGERGYELAAASLCFPSRWSLAEKIGRPMSEIHAPVPGFNEKIGSPVDRFFDSLEPEKLVFRVNWALHDTDEMYEPKAEVRRLDQSGVNPDITIDNIGERIWVRVERQTLRRLPETGWILFTIKTLVDPLNVLRERPDLAASLDGVLDGMPAEMALYKSIGPYRDALKTYLQQLRP